MILERQPHFQFVSSRRITNRLYMHVCSSQLGQQDNKRRSTQHKANCHRLGRAKAQTVKPPPN